LGVDRKEDAIVVDEKTGKAPEVVAAHDTFGTVQTSGANRK
jgi:hypothetical protein